MPILSAFLFINITIFIKSIVDLILIYNNLSKIPAEYVDYLLKVVFYGIVLVTNYYFRMANELCFIRKYSLSNLLEDTFVSFLIYCLILIGLINLFRYGLNVLIMLICFPILVSYFLRNPSAFYSNFGIDPVKKVK